MNGVEVVVPFVNAGYWRGRQAQIDVCAPGIREEHLAMDEGDPVGGWPLDLERLVQRRRPPESDLDRATQIGREAADVTAVGRLGRPTEAGVDRKASGD
jgi:hypothetical protein